MGFQQISDFNQPPVFQTFVAERQTDQPVFAFTLTTGYSELTLGTINKSLYTGTIAYTPVTTKGYWQVTTDVVSVGGKKLFSKVDSIIDTGTTLSEDVLLPFVYLAFSHYHTHSCWHAGPGKSPL